MSLLEALSQPLPRLWEALNEQAANAAENEMDLLLEEEIEQLEEEEVCAYSLQ
jgi:hypothetical protein